MAKRVTWAIPGDIDTVTGGYAYDRRIIAELRARGWTVDLLGLGVGFPTPSPVQKIWAEAQLLATASNDPIVIDGLAFGALPEVAAPLQRKRPVVALVHHPLALETGLAEDESWQLEISERTALSSAHRVIATSRWTADLLASRFNVPAERLAVILPGTDRVPFSTGSSGGPLHLISVGAIVPRKGFDLLVEALSRLVDLPWRLSIVGDRDRSPEATTRLDHVIAQHGLEARIDVPGKVSPQRLDALLSSADLFVLASHFEGYGMAFAEAIAYGLPVVGTTGGATPRTLPGAASRLVAPGDVAALADALRELIADDDRRRAMAAAARDAASMLASWPEAGGAFDDLLTELDSSSRPERSGAEGPSRHE